MVEEDPEKIRKAGNELFNAENIEGALEKYKEAIACGERGSQMSAGSLAKTYSNIAHCYNKKKKYVESIEASFKSMEADKAFVRPYLRMAHSYKMLENFNMSALALMKAKAMPVNEPNQTTVKAEIVRDWKWNHKVKQHFMVNGILDLNIFPTAKDEGSFQHKTSKTESRIQ